MQRWINVAKARYYQVELIKDLLGDWTLVQVWGGLDSKRGRMRVVWVPSQTAGLARLAAIGKQRGKRGYECDGE
jgi:hypothetical protein